MGRNWLKSPRGCQMHIKAHGSKRMHVDAIAEARIQRRQNLSLSIEQFSQRLQAALANNPKN